MSEAATETAVEDTSSTAEQATSEEVTQTSSQGNPGEDALGDAGKQALDRMKAERADAVRRATAAERELDKFRKASMTEQERAVAEAKDAGRLEAQREYGSRLAQTEFQRLAAIRNPGFDAAARLEFIDQSKFVGDDGDIDPKVIAKAVEAFVPEPEKSGSPSFDGGARSQSKTTNMNDVIRGLTRR